MVGRWTMKKMILAVMSVGAFVAGVATAQEGAEKKVKMQNLPAAVQDAVKQHSQGAKLRALATEVDSGKTVYEAEFTVDGHSKDITFDANGQVVSVEEETTLASIPAPARAAIQKAAG